LRLGWVIAPKEVISKLVMAKQGADLHTATFNQVVAYEVSRHGFIDEHVKKIVAVYKERRDVMLESLEENMPEGVHWTHPKGGLFLWATLPECIDTTQLLATALEQNVAFVPGTSFFANGGGQNTMRLNFSMMPPERIDEGIARLGKVIKKELT
ncbi:MAG: PLP-dependent aminotransferase family protein, partial [bacterium]